MHYLSGELFHQNKFPVRFIVLSLATCVLLFNWCLCPCPFPRHLHHIHILYVAFLECFFFYFSLVALPLLPCSTVIETLSSLYHYYYYIIYIIIAEWFIRIAATATTYSTAITMIVIRISALMQFMPKRKKINLWIKYNWKIFFHSGM